jgi:predicted DNA-binding transcriptional regulator AlpA
VRKPLLPSDASAEESRQAPCSTHSPRRHHLDRRASTLAEVSHGAPDDLLSTRAVAEWLGVSVQFLEIGRHRGYGPKFVRIGPARIRYRRADVLAWLEERTFASTSQYGEVA